MGATRDFLGTVIASGLELEMLSPEDVVGLVNMDVLAHHLPVDLKARLLSAALKSSDMTATLILDTLGVEGIVEHAPAPLLWKVLELGALRSMGEDGKLSSAATPALETSALAAAAAAVPTPSPKLDAARPSARKPNISARVSRVRAGATSRPVAITPEPEGDDSAFDVDTRVGSETAPSDFDISDEASIFAGDDVTAHGKD